MDGDYTRAPTDDNWYDVIIRDNTPPVITVVSADSGISEVILTSAIDDVQSAGFGGFNGKTGGMLENQEGIVIAVIDNNPYQHWNGYDAQDVDDPDSADVSWWAPFLQQAYYEIGADPRNLYGLGLQTGKADSPCVPGFFISTPMDLEDAESSNFANWEDQLIPQIEGEEYFIGSNKPISTISADCEFHYKPKKIQLYELDDANNNQSFYKLGTGVSGRLCSPFLFDTNNIGNCNFPGFSMPETIELTNVQHIEGNSNIIENKPNESYVMTFSPEEVLEKFGGGSDEAMIRFISQPDLYDYVDSNAASLDIGRETKSSFENLFDRDKSWRKTFWWIPADAFVLPYFLNPSSKGKETHAIWGKAYDLSYLSLREDGIGYYLGREDSGTASPTEITLPSEFATKLGTFDIEDNRPPNIKITFYDYKYNQFFKILLLDDYAHVYRASNSSKQTENVILMKTKDPRGLLYEGDVSHKDISSGRIPEADDYTYRLYKPASINTATGNLSALAGTEGNGAGLFNIRIAEDVRFKLRVEATDNAADPKDIEIQIESIKPSDIDHFTNTTQHVQDDDKDQYQFKTILSGSENVYQFQAFVTAYHMYPKSGFYDIIQVSVNDGNGNMRKILFPIEIVPQDVHFRSLGSQNKSR